MMSTVSCHARRYVHNKIVLTLDHGHLTEKHAQL